MENPLEAVEAAHASGKIKKGCNEATKALERGKAKMIVIAKDISPPELKMHLPLLAKEKGVPCYTVDSKEELGAAAGMTIPTAAVAIVSEGGKNRAEKDQDE